MGNEETRFKPGNNANPLGSNAHDPEKKAVKLAMKKLTAALVEEIVKDVLLVHPEKLGEENARDASVLKAWIAKAAEKGANSGDLGPLLQLLDRSVGTVKQKVEVTNKPAERTVEELEAELKLVQAKLGNTETAT